MPAIQNVCVFLGSSTGSNPAIAEATVSLGNQIAARNMRLVYGGGAVGLMGLLADTVLKAGGEVLGIIPANLFSREVAHRGLTELVETEGMHVRKALMYERSDAFVAIPGGFGTLDELAEVLTWRQIGLHNKPIGLLDVEGYFEGLLSFFDRAVSDGLVSLNNRQLVLQEPDPAKLLHALEQDQQAPAEKWD